MVHGEVPEFGRAGSVVAFNVLTGKTSAVHDAPFPADELVTASDNQLLLFDSAYGRWERRRISDWSLEDASNAQFGTHQSAGLPAGNGGFITATNGSPTIPVWRTSGPSNPDHPGLTAYAPISHPTALVLSPDGTNLAVADGGSIYVAPVAPENAVIPTDPICCEPEAPQGPVRGRTRAITRCRGSGLQWLAAVFR